MKKVIKKKLGKVKKLKGVEKIPATLGECTNDQLRIIIREKIEGWQTANALLTTRKNQAEIEAVKAVS